MSMTKFYIPILTRNNNQIKQPLRETIARGHKKEKGSLLFTNASKSGALMGPIQKESDSININGRRTMRAKL